jgi:hypothetical protein
MPGILKSFIWKDCFRFREQKILYYGYSLAEARIGFGHVLQLDSFHVDRRDAVFPNLASNAVNRAHVLNPHHLCGAPQREQIIGIGRPVGWDDERAFQQFSNLNWGGHATEEPVAAEVHGDTLQWMGV